MPAKYPDEFYVAHALFRGPSFPPEGAWGDMLDGPETSAAAVNDYVAERFLDPQSPPTAETLRVWHCAGGTVRDVLPEIIRAWQRFHPEVYA